MSDPVKCHSHRRGKSQRGRPRSSNGYIFGARVVAQRAFGRHGRRLPRSWIALQPANLAPGFWPNAQIVPRSALPLIAFLKLSEIRFEGCNSGVTI
jgi:hypothetical protein